jgi:hypothetical protein
MQDDWYDEVGWRYETGPKSREWHERYDGVVPLNDERADYKVVSPPRKVAFIGGLHSGKTTAAEVFVAKGYTKLSIAEPIKTAAGAALNGADIALRKIGVIRPGLNDTGWPDRDPMKDKDANRELFQFIGEYFRRDNPSIWINYFLRIHGHRDKVVIDDARNDQEVKALRDRGWTVIRVDRPLPDRIRSVQSKALASGRKMTDKQVKKLLKHDTESNIMKLDYDILIDNDENLYIFKSRVRKVAELDRRVPATPVDKPGQLVPDATYRLTPAVFHPLDPRFNG